MAVLAFTEDGRVFKTSPKLWLNLQNTYDLAIVRLESADKIAREVIRPASTRAEAGAFGWRDHFAATPLGLDV